MGDELDFGVGIAFGYATLGEIGFEGRSDYAAIGAVTILAARLSDEAVGGQILISQRTLAEVEDPVETEEAGVFTAILEPNQLARRSMYCSPSPRATGSGGASRVGREIEVAVPALPRGHS